MSGRSHRITIHFEGVEGWEDNQQKVDKILEEDTGTSEYPSTKSLPPIIVGPEVSQKGFDALKGLQGVIIREQDDD